MRRKRDVYENDNNPENSLQGLVSVERLPTNPRFFWLNFSEDITDDQLEDYRYKLNNTFTSTKPGHEKIQLVRSRHRSSFDLSYYGFYAEKIPHGLRLFEKLKLNGFDSNNIIDSITRNLRAHEEIKAMEIITVFSLEKNDEAACASGMIQFQ